MKETIIIYSTPTCAFCKTLKQYLDAKGVGFTEKDIEESTEAKEELLTKMGGEFRGVPTTDFNGEIIVGFDRAKIDACIAAL